MCILIWPVALSATDITIARSVVEATFSTAVSVGLEGGNKLSFAPDGTASSCSCPEGGGTGGGGGGGGGGGSGKADGVFFASALLVEGL